TLLFFFFYVILPLPGSPLFPYTTLFRSLPVDGRGALRDRRAVPNVLRRRTSGARRTGRVRRGRSEGRRGRVAPPVARRCALQPSRRGGGRCSRRRVWRAAARVL